MGRGKLCGMVTCEIPVEIQVQSKSCLDQEVTVGNLQTLQKDWMWG